MTPPETVFHEMNSPKPDQAGASMNRSFLPAPHTVYQRSSTPPILAENQYRYHQSPANYPQDRNTEQYPSPGLIPLPTHGNPNYPAPQIVGYFTPVGYGSGDAAQGPYPQPASPPPQLQSHPIGHLNPVNYDGMEEPNTGLATGGPLAGASAGRKKRICGLSKSVFILVCIIVGLIVAAVIGGSVAGVVLKNKNNDSGGDSNATESLKSSTTPIPPESSTTLTATHTPPPPPPIVYPLDTGTWVLDGGLSKAEGDCIQPESFSSNYSEVWKCLETDKLIIDIEDVSTQSNLGYHLNVDSSRFSARGIVGEPPEGRPNDPKKISRWFFFMEFTKDLGFDHGDVCLTQFLLGIFLGRHKEEWDVILRVKNANPCFLQNGENSRSNLTCTCFYLPR